MSKAPSEGHTRKYLRSICSRTSTALSFTPTTEAATGHGSFLCLIPYCAIEQTEETLFFIHHLSVPHPAPCCAVQSRNIMTCGDMRLVMHPVSRKASLRAYTCVQRSKEPFF